MRVIEEREGRLDVLVNNTGIAHGFGVGEVTGAGALGPPAPSRRRGELAR
jgi:NAD(P)-dependent dehydrogenase (short-subunit alcohol dehydrogenase family)